MKEEEEERGGPVDLFCPLGRDVCVCCVCIKVKDQPPFYAVDYKHKMDRYLMCRNGLNRTTIYY